MKIVRKIGTHSGKFHADDVTAVMLIKNFLPDYKDAEIVRTRNDSLLDTLDIVVDVGNTYDHNKRRYDHHQNDFQETYSSDYDIRLSASGLVFKHYGEELIQNTLKYLFDTQPKLADYKVDLDQNQLVVFKDKLYDRFFVCLDAIDNGVERYPADVEPRYSSNGTSLTHRIANTNASWWEGEADEDELFKQAMELAKTDYLDAVTYLYFSVFVVKDMVKEFVQKRFETDKSGQIVRLERMVSWKRALLELEEELGIKGEIKMVIYEDKNGSYRVQSVPIEETSFGNRAPLLKEWRGLRNEQLKEISGIDDIVFVHHSGFIGGAQSYDSALKMARLTLEQLN